MGDGRDEGGTEGGEIEGCERGGRSKSVGGAREVTRGGGDGQKGGRLDGGKAEGKGGVDATVDGDANQDEVEGGYECV